MAITSKLFAGSFFPVQASHCSKSKQPKRRASTYHIMTLTPFQQGHDNDDASSSMEDAESEDDFDSEEDDEDELNDPYATGGSALFHSFLAQIPREAPIPPPEDDGRTPQQHWRDFLHRLEASPEATKVLKITDTCLKKYGLEGVSEAIGRRDVVGEELIEAIESARGITHAILGHKVLQLLKESDQQKLILQTIISVHMETLTYIKLGSDNASVHSVGILDTSSLLEAFQDNQGNLSLNEIEIRGLELTNDVQVNQLAVILRRTGQTLRQFNFLHARVTSSKVSLDPLVAAARDAPSLDELRLVVVSDGSSNNSNRQHSAALVSATALSDLLVLKKKWWRLVLDGVGLTDAHCKILARMFSRDESCKVGDLLSLQQNPLIGAVGYDEIFRVFFFKQRMGLIKVDDKAWENKFDLVRSMNNLHGRLEFVQQGAFRSRSKWVDWLAKLGNLGWEDDKHKLNYIWFTVLEKPDFLTNR